MLSPCLSIKKNFEIYLSGVTRMLKIWEQVSHGGNYRSFRACFGLVDKMFGHWWWIMSCMYQKSCKLTSQSLVRLGILFLEIGLFLNKKESTIRYWRILNDRFGLCIWNDESYSKVIALHLLPKLSLSRWWSLQIDQSQNSFLCRIASPTHTI